MFDALLVGLGGGFLHGLFYAFFRDAAWLNTLITLSLLGLLGGGLMSHSFKLRHGFCKRNVLSAFLMGFIPNTIFLYLIGSDNLPVAFGFQAGLFTTLSALAVFKLAFSLKKQ